MPSVATRAGPAPAAPRQRLLVVDDEADVAATYRLLLQLEGFEVEVADNGLQALRAVEQHRPDLIVTDLAMPLMNGAELCHRLREQSRTQHIPIIMTSALAQPAGPGEPEFDEFIRKPVDPDRLLQRIRALLDGQADKP
jgi:CheY-like chemotaxis protein